MTEDLRRKIREAIVSGSVKGNLRTASGYPLTLGDCRSIKSLTIHGNDGGVGDKTNNLFDKDIAEVSSWTRGVLDASASTNIRYYIDITDYLTVGKTYTLDYKLKDTNDLPKYFYICSDDENIGSTLQFIVNNIYRKSVQVTPVEGKRYYIYSALVANNTVAAFPAWAAKFDGFRIVEGAYTTDTLPEYEPYGYRIPLMLNGEYILYSPASLMRSENITVDFESRSAKLAGMNISHLQQWGSVPTGAMVITANTTVAPSMMSVTYYIDTGVV